HAVDVGNQGVDVANRVEPDVGSHRSGPAEFRGEVRECRKAAIIPPLQFPWSRMPSKANISHQRVNPALINPIREWLREHRIDEVEAIIPDMTGIARGKIIPAA